MNGNTPKNEETEFGLNKLADSIVRLHKICSKALKSTWHEDKRNGSAILTIKPQKGDTNRLKLIRATTPIAKELEEKDPKNGRTVLKFVIHTKDVPFKSNRDTDKPYFSTGSTYKEILNELKAVSNMDDKEAKVERLNKTLQGLTASLAVGAISFHDWIHIARQVSPTTEQSNMVTSPFYLLSGKAMGSKNADEKEKAHTLNSKGLISRVNPVKSPKDGKIKLQCQLCKRNIPKCKALRPQNAGAVWDGYTIDLHKTPGLGTLEFRARLISLTTPQMMARTLTKGAGKEKSDDIARFLAGEKITWGGF